jgi:hypothetical protein
MKRNDVVLAMFVVILAMGSPGCGHTTEATRKSEAIRWKAHDMNRPKPPVITPVREAQAVPAPEKAIVLFDGTDLSQWTAENGREAKWKVQDGYMEIVPGAGGIRSKPRFGDVLLHVEWRTPNPPNGKGQGRANSGIFLMGLYEVQVLDSYQADTYADGQAGSIYGQYPPRFNACLPPGEWQTYDIYFRRPRFGAEGKLEEAARITLVHNGILIQDNEELLGPTSWLKYLPYKAHDDMLPIGLQDHGTPVRFRNIWALPLQEFPAPDASYATAYRPIEMSTKELDRYTGIYDRPNTTAPITITRENNRLFADFYWRQGGLELLPLSRTEFVLKDTDGRIVFDLNGRSMPTGLTFYLGGDEMRAQKRQK